MPAARQFAEVGFTLTDIVVASYNVTTGVFGTPAPMALGQKLEITFEADIDALKAYGRTVALLTVVTGGKIKIKGGGVDYSVLATLCGVVNTESGTTPSQKRKNVFKAGGSGFPYFGALGVMATDDGGAAVIGLQACMLDAFPSVTFDGEANKFNMSETDGRFMPIDISSSPVAAVGREYETASEWTAPVSAAGFGVFFTGS